MRNRILAVIALVLFLFLLADLFIFKVLKEAGVILYVLIITVFLLFFNKKKNDE